MISIVWNQWNIVKPPNVHARQICTLPFCVDMKSAHHHQMATAKFTCHEMCSHHEMCTDTKYANINYLSISRFILQHQNMILYVRYKELHKPQDKWKLFHVIIVTIIICHYLSIVYEYLWDFFFKFNHLFIKYF